VADLVAAGQADKPVAASPEKPQAADHPVPYAVRAAADWSWRLLVIVAAVALLGWVAWQLRLVVFPIAVAILLAALLQPGVRWLRDKGWRRGWAAATVFVAFLILVSGSLTLVGGAVSGQFGEVVEQAGEGLVELEEWLGGPPFYLTEEQIDAWVDRILEALGQDEAAITEGAVSTATAAIEFLTGMVLAFVALALFLYDGERIWAWTVRTFPRSSRAHADGAGREAWATLTSYIRGQTVVALFDAVFITILLFILGVPLALPLGVLVFFGAYVPLVGAVVSGALAVLVALVANGLVIALIVLAGIIAVQQLEGNVFAPMVLGRMARIHPLAVIVAITVGVLIAGILGGIVAVPIVAIANSVGKYLTSGAA
jgi:predicted PurR-regulated permease PerM